MEPVSVFLLGGCLLHGPIHKVVGPGKELQIARLSRGGGTPGTYTFGEMLQVIRLCRGETEMPAEIRLLCGVAPDFTALRGVGAFESVDVALVEPGTPIEIKFRGFSLNRVGVFKYVTNPLKEISREAAKLTNVWVNKGLFAFNEAVRAETADKLIGLIPATMPHRDLAAAVLKEARGEMGDVQTGLEQVKESLGCPIGVVTYIFQFMPDGRPVSWPATFRDDVVAAAQNLGLPTHEPWQLVGKHGVGVALKSDLRHYQDSFLPVVAESIAGFALEIGRKSLEGQRQPHRAEGDRPKITV